MSATAIESPGCVILLIDESAAMESTVQEELLELGQELKSKGASAATAINSLLKQLAAGPDFDVALVGYRSVDAGPSVAKVRWSGPLAGREFVSTRELAANPVSIETRQRRVPDPSSFSGYRAEPVEVPVWYSPEFGGIASQVLAFQTCKDLLERWSQSAGPNPGQSLVIHLFAAGSGDGNPSKVIEELRELTISGQPPLVYQAHLSTAKSVPPTLYSSNRTFLQPGPSRDLFERCSPLTSDHSTALKAAKLVLGANARGMLFNAKMIDIVRFLSLVKTHVQNWPPRPASLTPQLPSTNALTPQIEAEVPDDVVIVDAPAEAASNEVGQLPVPGTDTECEQAALVVFLLDRSVCDPFSADPSNPYLRLQEQANELLGKIAKNPTGQIDVAVISYGVDSVGEVEVRNTFEAGLTGRTLVADTELESGAIRTKEFDKQIPNGIGGLITVPQKQHILVELEPTSAAAPGTAFEAVAAVLSDWCGRHPQACVPPVVLHLTRGQHSASDLEPAAVKIQSMSVAAGSVVLYHAIATDAPHTSISYCETDIDLESPELKAAFAVSSPLLGRDQLLESKPALVKPLSRGFVVNGKFDLLLDGIRDALSRE